MKFLVLKEDDINKYCTPYGKELLAQAIFQVKFGRADDGKEMNKYLVINTDEPYADEVIEIMKRHRHWE